jgi:hypothetical protein
MGTETQQNKNVGSAYMNLKKGSSGGEVDRLAEIVEELTQLGAYVAISLRQPDGDGFVKFTGFFNNYKRDGQKDPDIMIKKSEVGKSSGGVKKSYGPKKYDNRATSPSKYQKGPATRPTATRPVPKQEVQDDSESEEIPF